MKKNLLIILLLLGLSPAITCAQVFVRVAPPPIIVERPAPPPGPRYVWIAGYHRWNGTRYVWVPGHYVMPPRHGVVWVPAHWAPRKGGWVFVAGRWH